MRSGGLGWMVKPSRGGVRALGGWRRDSKLEMLLTHLVFFAFIRKVISLFLRNLFS